MPVLFWLDVAAYGISTVVATALALMVLAAGSSRSVNRRFAAFAMAEAVWAACSFFLRISLWASKGNPLLLLELATLSFALMGPFLLMFTVRYVGRPARRADGVASLGFLATAVLSIPLFRHQIISNPHIVASGATGHSLTLWGTVVAVLPALYFLWSLILFWQERHRTGETYMGVSVLILLVGFALGGVIVTGYPVMSFTVTFSVLVLGYGIVSRQLLNPLRELTAELERKVAERTQELERTANTLSQQAAYLRTAAEVARSVSAIRDVDQLLQDTVRLISDRFGFYHAGIFLLDEAKEYAVLRAASSEGGRRMLERGHRLKVGEEGIVGYVAGSGEPRIALDVGEDAVYFDNPDLSATRSEMALPLKVRGEVIGVLDVQSDEPAAFTDEDVAVLQILADQLAVGLENARLFSQIQSSLDEVSRVYRMMAERSWRELIQARPELRRYQAGAAAAPDGAWELLFAKARSLGEPVTDFWEGEGGGLYVLAVPVRLRGVSIGVVGFHRPAEAGAWRPEEIELATGVAERMALALENIRLLEEAQRRAARERAVAEVASRVRASLDPDAVLRATVRELGRVLGARWTAIEVTGPDGGNGGSPAGEGPKRVGEE